MTPQHEVIVYDENENELEKTITSIYVAYIKRAKHIFSNGVTYSFNSYLYNGFICYDMVQLPPFSEA